MGGGKPDDPDGADGGRGGDGGGGPVAGVGASGLPQDHVPLFGHPRVLGRRLVRREALVDAMARLLRLGPALVILSLGADGALLATAAPFGIWLARPPTVKADSAVGAGDSLVGGFLVGWASGRPLVEAFRLGVASGTAAAMTPGTELCHRADVRRLLPRVAVRRLAC